MDFRQLIRETVGKSDRGIELGASYAPILPKAQGYRVLVVDHADQETLRTKYRPHGVDVDRIEPVDAIDDGGEFTDLLDDGERFDYIVASHVFEHLPDPIHFLQRCERALKDTGRLILLIPDRRFCFDYLRPVSTAGQMLRAFLAGQRRHDPGALYDHYGMNATRDGVQVWAGPDGGSFAFAGTPAAGYAFAVQNAADYVDCHAWVFTPSSCRLIFSDLRALGLIAMGEAFFHPTIGCEFMVVLQRSASGEVPERSELARRALLEAAEGGVHLRPQPVPVAAGADTPKYVRGAPRPQNMVDLFAGSWVGALPPSVGVSAGATELCDDHRIKWLIAEMGGVEGLDILELGPLEASHTAMLLQAGANSVLGVEANRDAFLRCLVVKELRGLRDASFLLGDFVGFLEEDRRHWPLIVASGVLYHAVDPLRLLDLLAERTDVLFLWTHVVDDAAMPAGDPRRALIARTEEREWRGRRIPLHVRPYAGTADPKFCGGPDAEPRWMARADLLQALATLGFDDLTTGPADPDHPAGPALTILARRRR